MNVLYSASGVLTLFYALLVLSKRSRSIADYILVVWFFLILLVIVISYVNYNQIQVWQGFFELTDSSVFLHGPVIWFYTRALTDPEFRFSRRDLFHLLPFLIGLAYLVWPLSNGHVVSVQGRNVILIAKMMFLVGYGIAVLTHLKHHERNIAHYYSYTEKVKLNWLKLIIISLMVIWMISVISQLLYAYSTLDIPQYGGYYTSLAVCSFVLVLGYFGIRQTTVFTSISDLKDESFTSEDSVPAMEADNSKLQEDYQQLIDRMVVDKPFLDGELTLYKLADEFRTTPHRLSRIINRQAGKSFYDFVNYYRIEEWKECVRRGEHQHKTLLAIAFDSGFNSKASFQRVFKKLTGLTPSEFVKLSED